MDHDEALRARAATRYVQNKLSPEERDAFEEHFFDCQMCSARVNFEVRLGANIRGALRDTRAQPGKIASPAAEVVPLRSGIWNQWRKWLQPALAFSAAANLILFAGIVYTMSQRAHDRGEAQLAVAYFAPGPAHGADFVHSLPAGQKYYVVRFIAPAATSASYAYEILDPAGKRTASGSLRTPAGDDDFLYLQVPVGNLPAGVYTLVVRGAPGGQIVSWSRFSQSR